MEINGKKIAENIFDDLSKRVKKIKEKRVVPHLAIIFVGNDPASKAYIRQKKLKAEEIGVKVSLYNFSLTVPLQKLLLLINKLNHNPLIHGIIVQRPLPSHINADKISLAVDSKKDIDAFGPDSKFSVPIACAVLKILEEIYKGVTRLERLPTARTELVAKRTFEGALAERTREFACLTGVDRKVGAGPRSKFLNWLKSKKVVVVGKGETGGGPTIEMFKKMRIEPKVIDSKTKNPERLIKDAEVIISAVGKPNIIKLDTIKKNSILISIGLHKENNKLYGDYDEEKIENTVSFYTPTPGGVGPVNVACLLENLVLATEELTA